jgi:hypothetical protein
MKNKELKDLLILLRNYMLEHKDACSGICVLITFMQIDGNITLKQGRILSKYLKDNLPKRKYKLLVDHESNGKYITTPGQDFCWKPFSLKPRLNWINKQIKKLES